MFKTIVCIGFIIWSNALLAQTKCVFKHQNLQIFGIKLKKYT